MAIETVCSGCGKRLQVDDQFVGRQARCPVCSMVYTVGGGTHSDSNQVASASGATTPGSADESIKPTQQQTGSGGTTPSATPFQPSSPVQDPRVQPIGIENAPLDGTYWARTPDGNIYGPADHASVKRWIQEGRLSKECALRVGEQGEWRSAPSLFPELAPNVYANSPQAATQPYAAPVFVSTRSGLPPDRSVLVLVMGILSWVLGCACIPGFICSVIGTIIGFSDLKSMNAGRMDPTNRSMTQIGYYLSLISLILYVVGFVFYVGAVIISLFFQM